MDTYSRRAFTRLALATAASGWLPASAQTGGATGKLLVGYPAGGTLDTTARQLAEAWRKQGRQYIVDNRAGAAGRIANSQLKREKADGSTLLCTHASALTIYPHVYSRLMYDAAADLVPVSPVVAATCAFAVSSRVPAGVKNAQDYVAWVRRSPEGATYASPAAGSMAHFLGYQLSEAGNLKMQHVGYRGSAPAMQDLLGGQIPAYFGFVADFLPYLQSGKVRILGVAAEKRSPFLDGILTFAEQGFATIRGGETYGVFAPPGTPEASVKALHESIVVASREPGLRAAFEQVGLEPSTLAPLEYARQIQREREFWGPWCAHRVFVRRTEIMGEQDMNQDREALIARAIDFLEEAKDVTAGTDTERWLNENYGRERELYRTLSRLVQKGVDDGWAANVELDGPVYRRSRIAEASPRTHHFSITAVYMDSRGNRQGNPDGVYRGQYHAHPYGEFNMVVPLNPGAALNGPNGWCEEGWTAPAPGSHHYPEARGGAVIALFFLPAGRIAYHPAPEGGDDEHAPR